MTCAKCSIPLVPAHETPPKGHRAHQARGLCTSCYFHERMAGRLESWPRLTPPPRTVHDPAVCALCEDIGWMAETGSPPWEWARRLGTNPRALERRLRRHGLGELANKLERVVRAA